jgi:hypothetical protein
VKGECRSRGSRICAAHPVAYPQCRETESSKVGAWWNISDLGFVNYGKDYLRSWGYVIWDRQRLNAWKNLEKETNQSAGPESQLSSAQ